MNAHELPEWIQRLQEADESWLVINGEQNQTIVELEAQLATANAVCEAFHSWATEHGPTFGADSDRWQAVFAAHDAWQASRTPTEDES